MTAARRVVKVISLLTGAAVILYGFSFAEAQNHRVALGNACTTPQGQPGTCTVIDSCESLRRIVRQRPIPQKDLNLLRLSRCAIRGMKLNVCCPNPRGGYAQTSRQISTPLAQEASTTPASQGGALNRAGENLASSSSDLENHPNFRLLSTDRCGSDLTEKIINGEEASLGEYPWIAAMEYQTDAGLRVWCGGTLINDRYVVTAAHCVKGIGNNRLVNIRLGEHNLQTDPDCVTTETGQICADSMQSFKPAEIVAHPEYIVGSKEQYNDIALIRLDRKVAFSSYILPICLPGGNALTKKYEGAKMIVAGWGRTENGTSSNVKMWVQIVVMSTAECQPKYQRQLTLSENQMCAGGVDRKDSCRGDSGGPLMVTDSVVRNRPSAQWALAGIVSIGPKICGSVGNPGIYTRVGPYVSWILDNLKP